MKFLKSSSLIKITGFSGSNALIFSYDDLNCGSTKTTSARLIEYSTATSDADQTVASTLFLEAASFNFEENKVEGIIKQLFDYYLNYIDKTIDEKEDIIKLAVCDYIAGMTDRYAVCKYEDLFIPKSAQNKKSDEQIFKLIGISGVYAK